MLKLVRAVCLLFLVCCGAQAQEYQIKDYTHLLGKVGLDDALMTLHFALYGGYVKNTNALVKEIAAAEPNSYQFGALQRRLTWEFDGMRLHEFFFENMKEKGVPDPKSEWMLSIKEQFGSFDKWKEQFAATGMIRGIGWVALYYDPQVKKMLNVWIDEHNVGELAGGTILLVMDVFEHAYLTQFGLKRGEYIQTFLDHVNWNEVAKRYRNR